MRLHWNATALFHNARWLVAYIRRRCTEFPLDVTVGRPRYVWSPDRKRQGRRTYDSDRFKP